MTTTENGLRKQIADEGMLLKNGDNYTKMVYLGEGAQEWEQVEDTGQIDIGVVNAKTEIIN